MIVLSIAKLKMFSLNKAEKEKKTSLWKVWMIMPTFRSAQKSNK